MVRLQQKLAQKQVLTPQQILQASLLQLNTLNLEQKILEELETNPVIEQVESSDENDYSNDEQPGNELDLPDWIDDYEGPNVYEHPEKKEEIPVAEQEGFIDSLLKQLDLQDLGEIEREIAEEIIYNLDNRGYLGTDLILIADRFEKTEEEILPVLKIINQLEPQGLGARNLQECLAIQLENQRDSIAYQIIHKCFNEFANRRYELVQRKLGINEEELQAAIDIIRHLNPRPGEGLSGQENESVVPDLIAWDQEGKWVVQVNDTRLPEIRINSYYESINSDANGITPDAKKYIRQKIDSANWFIYAIEQRHQTLKKVMLTIIEKQPEFFEGKLDQLRPMRLQDVAEEISMDISTVSRSTRGKYVDLPFGVYELKSFFTEGLETEGGEVVSTHQIKQALKDIIEKENKKNPCNDEKLVAALAAKGYNVARRTVAKYREQLHFPVARLRRQL